MADLHKQNGSVTELRPSHYLEKSNREALHEDAPALILLNSPLDDLEYYRRLSSHAQFVLCADGGANRLHDLCIEATPGNDWNAALNSDLPDLIHGDLDSLRDDVRQHYAELGVKVTQDPDQYSTDFGKAVKQVVSHLPRAREVLVLGSVGGRVDQGIGLLHELYREQKAGHPRLRFWFFSESSITILLRPGTTKIHTPLKEGLITQNVGILPLYGKAVISTKGLEWDVEDWPTEMGGNLSTSNHIIADEISIATDFDVLFTVERQS